MKSKFIQLSAMAAAVLMFAGCANIRLDEGRYECTDNRDDFSVWVCNDLIFVRVLMPENAVDGNQYRDWAGKYSIDSDNEITLKMDDEKLRDWQFYFGMRKTGKSITIDDFGRNQSYRLIHENAGRSPKPMR